MEMIIGNIGIGNAITLVTLGSKRILSTQAQLAKCYADAERLIVKRGGAK